MRKIRKTKGPLIDFASIPIPRWRYAGNGLIFHSGKIGVDGGRLVVGGVAEEISAVIESLEADLQGIDRTLGDVVFAYISLVNGDDFELINHVWAEFFEYPYPARDTVGAAWLPYGAKIKIWFISRGEPPGKDHCSSFWGLEAPTLPIV